MSREAIYGDGGDVLPGPSSSPRTVRAFGTWARAMGVLKDVVDNCPQGAAVARRLFARDRASVFRFWDRLSQQDRDALVAQLVRVDWDLLERNLALLQQPERLEQRTAGTLKPPRVLDPSVDPDASSVIASGEEVLREGWLAVVEGAGGAGSRFSEVTGSHPKGLFPISPSGSYNFFEARIQRLIALRRRYQRPIPYIVMVSEATEQDTKAFFERRGFFGLEDEILIVNQRSLPYVEEVGPGAYDLVLEQPGRIAVGGYGHADFTKCVLLKPEVLGFLKRFGVRYVQWVQIDNPLASIGHRYFLGAHRRAEPTLNPNAIAMSFISIEKTRAAERAGVLVRRGDALAVWEYSDMDPVSQHLLEDEHGAPCLAVRRNEAVETIRPDALTEGDVMLSLSDLPPAAHRGLRYRWGALNPNLVLVTLESVVAHPEDNPPLLARKWTKHVDADGDDGDPNKKFIKFETFLFDGLNDGVVVAEARENCFAPAKNSQGKDSPGRVREALIAESSRCLRRHGWEVDRSPDTVVDLGGLLELSEDGFEARVGRNGRIEAGARFVVLGLDVRIGDGLTVRSGGELIIRDTGEEPKAPLTVSPRVILSPGAVIGDQRASPA